MAICKMWLETSKFEPWLPCPIIRSKGWKPGPGLSPTSNAIGWNAGTAVIRSDFMSPSPRGFADQNWRPQTRGLSDVSLKSTDLNDPLHSRPICGHVPYRHWIMDGAERSMPARGKRWIMSSLPARPPGWPRPKRPMWRPAGNA